MKKIKVVPPTPNDPENLETVCHVLGLKPRPEKLESVVRKFVTKHFSPCRHKATSDFWDQLPLLPWKVVHRKGWAGHTILAADGSEVFLFGQSTLEVCQFVVGMANNLHDFKKRYEIDEKSRGFLAWAKGEK